jgi:outer membrane protein OmpA-like peptidoglycan-associated protein
VAAPTTTAPPSGAQAVAADVGVDLYTPVRWAIFQGGKVRLLGRVPNQQVAATIATKAEAVVGPGNVSVEYVIDPTAPAPPAAPLYVRDTVQFAPGSAAVAPQFAPLLDLGVRLMQQNPGVRIWVLGRADSIGDPQANLMLSLRRSQAVMAYLVAAGIDESRLIAVPLGTDAALGDNATAEGRQQNRSVEFVISGLLS